MAAGRGEFFRSLMEGLGRKPTGWAPERRKPGRGRGKPGPGRGRPGGRWRMRPPKACPSSVSGKEHSVSWTETSAARQEVHFHRLQTSSKENFIQRLPSEILIKILSYLDSTSLFCIGHVSRLFHQLANDDVMWQRIYMWEFGSQVWKRKSADDVPLKVEPVESGDRMVGHWKKLYFRSVAGHDLNKWRKELRDLNPYTGLPRQTWCVLRNLNVSWELTVCDCFGRENTLEPSRAYFFESSMIIRWSGGSFPEHHHIRNIQLHGVRKETPKGPDARPGWRSLILTLDMKPQCCRFIGKDRLIRLMHLSTDFIIGVWRGQSSVAFIMASLHSNKLVEKSLLGSPVCPYSEPEDPRPVDESDPEFGLHGYTLHFVLHNTGAEIMSGHFRNLSCRPVQIQRRRMELRVINRTDLSQHRSLSGNIKMPWKTESLEGAVENCCIISLTLLDEFQKPFWCVSSPVCVRMAKRRLSFDYSGEHFVMEHQDPEGKVEMKLVWLKEQQQFFLISLIIYVPICKVNKHFSTKY